jgi:uncharacterized protein (TIGR02001 family)
VVNSVVNNSQALTLAGLLLASGVAADEGSLRLEADLTQLYVWRGLDLLDGHAALQPSATWDSGAGWYAGAWGSLSLDRGSGCREITGEVCQDWDELDLYTGVYGTLGAAQRWRAEWDLGFTYFAFPQQPRSADTVELGLKVRHAGLFGEGAPVLRWALYYDRGAQEPGEEGVWLLPGLDWTVPLAGRSVDFSVEVGYKDGDSGLWSYTGLAYATLALSTGFRAGGWTLTPRLHVQQNLAGDPPGIHPFSGVWVDVALSYGR